MDFRSASPQTEQEMLAALGVSRVEELLAQVPEQLLDQQKWGNHPDFREHSELETAQCLEALCRNCPGASLDVFAGYGVYDHYVPAAVWRLAGRGDFATAYTPYQPEASQGTLQAIYEYQTAVCRLYSMDIANASLYDGASAVAEAALMACRITNRHRVAISQTVHPHYRRVLATFARGLGIEVREIPMRQGRTDFDAWQPAEYAALIQASPNWLGLIEDWHRGREAADACGALLVGLAQPVACGLLQPPGVQGADIVVGEGQALGLGLWLGGNTVGHLATRMDYIRQLPGRIVGKTVDRDGRPGYCLTFQTREQHIRREKATSNICSNQNLNALANLIYLALLGDQGLAQVASLSHSRAQQLADGIAAIPGCRLPFPGPFLLEFIYCTPVPAVRLLDRLRAAGILGGRVVTAAESGLDQEGILVAVTEKRTPVSLERYLSVVRTEVQHV